MNIALFPSAFAPHFGGVEELSRQLALELKRQGHEVVVLTNRWPRDLPAQDYVDGIKVYRLPFRLPVEGSVKSRVMFSMTHQHVMRQTIAILKRHRIEVMNVQCVSSNVLYALEARRLTGIPLVVTLQGELTMDATKLYQRSQTARDLLLRAMNEAELVTGCSAKTLDDAEAFFGMKLGSRRRVIFNAARVEDFSTATPFAHPRPYAFAVGRCVPQKGFDLLLRAFSDASIKSHDLVIAGDGPELPALKSLAEELRLSDRVLFFGRADRGQVASLFAGCSFFVLPSRADEGLPVVCAEAMAAGKAIVATRSGGVPEAIVDGESGLIVERGDVEGLSTAIGRMARDERLAARFAREATQAAARFSWQTITSEYVTSYLHAIGLVAASHPESSIASGVASVH